VAAVTDSVVGKDNGVDVNPPRLSLDLEALDLSPVRPTLDLHAIGVIASLEMGGARTSRATKAARQICMAKRKNLCDLCGVEFQYPSKLRRHLQTATHKRYSESLQLELAIGPEPSSTSETCFNNTPSISVDELSYQVNMIMMTKTLVNPYVGEGVCVKVKCLVQTT